MDAVAATGWRTGSQFISTGLASGMLLPKTGRN
jgi:hypothetical protein